MIILKIKWHNQGFYDLRRASGVQTFLNNEAIKISSRAGEGFRWDSKQGNKGPSTTGGPGYQGRWRTTVFAATPKAMKRNAKHNTLLRALGGG